MKYLNKVITALAIGVGATTFAHEAKADFPERAITVMLPFGPGGGTDMLTRSFDLFARDVFGHNFTIEYRPGGGSAVGTTALAREAADGYTIGMGSLPHMYLQPAAGAGQYTLDDFDYIALIAREPQLMVTPLASPYDTYEELKAAAQASPGRLTLGIPSPLSETWLAYERVNAIEDLGFTVITYQGGGQMNAALLGNQVDAAMTNIGPVFGEIENLKVLGVTSDERVSFLPDVPTFRELGVDVVTSVERVFMAPKGVPEDRLEVLRDGFREIWHNPDFQARMEELRFGMAWLDGAEVRDYLEEQKEIILEIYEAAAD
jgi:tripartite-type tricarboxylate transporter receptor subunit TctC